MAIIVIVCLIAAALLFGIDAWLSKSLIALGLLAFVLAFLIPAIAAAG